MKDKVSYSTYAYIAINNNCNIIVIGLLLKAINALLTDDSFKLDTEATRSVVSIFEAGLAITGAIEE